jgi:uncharacterized protein (TIGR03067 family)
LIPFVLFGAIGCGAPVNHTGTAGDRSDDEKIEGRWRVVSAKRFKKRMSEPVGQVWTFVKGSVTFSKDDWSQEVTFSLNPNASPKIIELGPKDSPRSQVGLYSIDRDKLKLCLVSWNDPRPVNFTTAERENRMVLEFERED